MELQVTFTLSDRLFTLLENKLPNLGRRVEKAITKELGAQARKELNVSVAVNPEPSVSEAAAEPEPAPAPTPEPAQPEAPEQAAGSEKNRRTRRAKADAPEAAAPVVAAKEVPQPEAPEQAAEPKPFAEPPVQQPEKSHGEMIREIMHHTRQRFEGEDYKENTESDAYKKYHRAMTAQFKQIAMTLGYEKPSLIDTTEKVNAFAAECEALILDENGFIVPPPAPF